MDERFEKLSDKLDKYHLETLDQIHKIALRVEAHDRTFKIMTWMVPSGALIGVFAVFKEFIIR